MFLNSSVAVSQSLLGALGTQIFVYNQHRIPSDAAVIVVSNHRSFMDASVLISALGHPMRIVCHHYMSQVPVMREVVNLLGCFPLDKPENRQKEFFKKATELLKTQQWVGIFPEGAQPMVQKTKPEAIGTFERGFAHLALRAPVPSVVVLPVAIASTEESVRDSVPLKLLSYFDPSEPLFNRPGLHPLVIYHRVNVLIGKPYWITDTDRQDYKGKGARIVTTNLSQYCKDEITQLLSVGFK